MDPAETRDLSDPRDLKETLVVMVLPERLVLEEYKETQERKVPVVCRAALGRRGLLVELVLSEPPARGVSQVYKENQVNEERRGQEETRASVVGQGHEVKVAQWASLVLRGLKVNKACRVRPARRVVRAEKGRVERWASRAVRGREEAPALQVLQVFLVRQAPRAVKGVRGLLVGRDKLEPMVHVGYRDLLEHRVSVVTRAREDLLVDLGLLETRDRQDPLAPLVDPVLMEHPDPQDQLVALDLLDPMELEDLTGLLDQKADPVVLVFPV